MNNFSCILHMRRKIKMVVLDIDKVAMALLMFVEEVQFFQKNLIFDSISQFTRFYEAN